MNLNPEKTEKIANLLRKANLDLPAEDLNRIAQCLLELGLFLVQMEVRKHSKHSKPTNFGYSTENSGEPP